MKHAFLLSILLLSVNSFAQSNAGERGGDDDRIELGQEAHCVSPYNVMLKRIFLCDQAAICSVSELCADHHMEADPSPHSVSSTLPY